MKIVSDKVIRHSLA